MSLPSPSLLSRQRQADAYLERGNRLARQNQAEAAVQAYRKALEINPQLAEAANNLGNVLAGLGQIDDARQAYVLALTAGQDHPLVHYNLARTLRRAGHQQEAMEHYSRALEHDPNHALSHNGLGNCLRDLGRWEEAAHCYLEAAACAPDLADIHANLASVLYLLHDSAPALSRSLAQRWIDGHPTQPIARHQAAAFGLIQAETLPAQIESAYIRDTFDRFAHDFEDTLAHLNYRAPALVCCQLSKQFSVSNPTHHILDAGCGTGLCGPGLRPLTVRLSGVDLSKEMLRQASLKKCYDELHEAELVAFLAKIAPGSFDAIVAADVFCYFGDFTALLHATTQALASEGYLIFTVEQAPQSTDIQNKGYTLFPHGRYGHTPAAIHSALLRHGFQSLGMQEEILRYEQQRPVPGLVVTARKRVLETDSLFNDGNLEKSVEQ